MRSFIKPFLISLVVLLFLIVGAAGILWINFEAVINSKYFKSQASELANDLGVKLNSECINFNVSSSNKLRKDIVLQFGECRIQIQSELEVYVNRGRLQLSFDIGTLKLIKINNADFEVEYIRLKEKADKKNGEDDALDLALIVADIISVLDDVSVVERLHVVTNEITVNPTLQFKDIDVKRAKAKLPYHFSFKGSVENIQIDSNGTILSQDGNLLVESRSNIKDKKVQIGKIFLSMLFSDDLVEVKLEKGRVASGGHAFQIERCTLRANYTLDDLSVSPCALKVEPSEQMLSDMRKILQAKSVKTDISLKVVRDKKLFRVKGKVGPFGNSIFEITAMTHVEFTLPELENTDEIVNRLIYGSNVDLTIFKFSVVQELLKIVDINVPAPLNQFDGILKVHTIGRREDLRTDATFELDLKNKVDRLRFAGDGFVAHDKIVVNAHVHNCHLTLPEIGKKVERITVIPDERFEKKNKEPKNRKVKRDVFIHLTSVEGTAFEVKYKSFEKSIPIRLNLEVGPSGTAGTVSVTNFDFKTLKREIKLEILLLELEKSQDPKVSAKIHVDFAEYDIFVEVYGPVSRPNLKLSSEPPLSREEIISVLLFEKKIDLLAEDSRGSVRDTEAAIADSAFTLASLYFLASTPIESVSYDPTARAVIARVALRDGTVVTLGVDDSSVNRLGLSQRLGKGWYINTGISELGEEGSSVLSALLEKVFRY